MHDEVLAEVAERGADLRPGGTALHYGEGQALGYKQTCEKMRLASASSRAPRRSRSRWRVGPCRRWEGGRGFVARSGRRGGGATSHSSSTRRSRSPSSRTSRILTMWGCEHCSMSCASCIMSARAVAERSNSLTAQSSPVPVHFPSRTWTTVMVGKTWRIWCSSVHAPSPGQRNRSPRCVQAQGLRAA